MILHFARAVCRTTTSGWRVELYWCVEHPRLGHLQVSGMGSPHQTDFIVEGVERDFQSIDDALEALRVTQRPGEIVAVPPRGVPREL